jgi:hypothetical protein
MGETPTLIPKRKLQDAFSTSGGDSDTQTLNTINETIINNYGSGSGSEVMPRLHVTFRLRIPVGVDCYD